jgi:hypothetical protein
MPGLEEATTLDLRPEGGRSVEASPAPSPWPTACPPPRTCSPPPTPPRHRWGWDLGGDMVSFFWWESESDPCSLGLSATSQQYLSLRINQPPATSQQYFSLRTNQHQPSSTSQTNRLRATEEKSSGTPS